MCVTKPDRFMRSPITNIEITRILVWDDHPCHCVTATEVCSASQPTGFDQNQFVPLQLAAAPFGPSQLPPQQIRKASILSRCRSVTQQLNTEQIAQAKPKYSIQLILKKKIKKTPKNLTAAFTADRSSLCCTNKKRTVANLHTTFKRHQKVTQNKHQSN